MFSIRQVLVPTFLLAAVSPAALYSASATVQYVGGTVKSIPVNTTGEFNFDDAKEFRFVYNGSEFKLPYDQITSTEIERADIRRVLHVFPVMSPVAAHRKQTLVINYTDASGATGTVNFELMAYRAEEAQQTIAAKKSPISPAAAAAASNEWWGDSVWKTKRNLPMWQAQEAAIKASQEADAAKKAQAAAAPTQPDQVATTGSK
ncbi:MAG TPA: hypothetical protein VMD76_06545 [Candidatus Sulfotelmatobacter sp.]|nr:hypothetical protein [Candidatus Sulfotelmatobacter sp.]